MNKNDTSKYMLYLSWRVDPSKVTEMAISWTTNHFSSDGFELVNPVAKCNDLRRAHKGTALINKKDNI
jgi:hypothetical protein